MAQPDCIKEDTYHSSNSLDELHYVQNLLNYYNYDNEEYNRQLVLKKDDDTQADFDSSMVWYYNHLEDLYKIYERVQHRLSEDALAQGTSVRELQQFTKTYSHNSDTTDVWDGKRYLLLYPQAPFHVYQFKQKADSTYHAGDSFLFT